MVDEIHLNNNETALIIEKKDNKKFHGLREHGSLHGKNIGGEQE